MLLRGAAFLFVFVSLAGCDAAPSSAPPPAKGRETAPRVVIADVAWPPLDRLDRSALAALSPDAAGGVAKSSVPVLAPPDAELLSQAVVVVGEHWYSLSARLGMVTLVVSGTRLSHVRPEIPATRGTHDVRGTRGFVTRNEGIPSATWTENGTSYVLEVECGEATDTRCQGEAYLRELAEKLVYLGGAGAGVAR